MPLSNLAPTDLFTAVETKIDAAIDKINELDLTVLESAPGTPKLLIKRVNIGDWNMDTTSFVIVDVGVSRNNIVSISVMIRANVQDDLVPLNCYNAGNIEGGVDGLTFDVTDTEVQLSRRTGGYFDSNSFDATSYNRGYITIIYVE